MTASTQQRPAIQITMPRVCSLFARQASNQLIADTCTLMVVRVSLVHTANEQEAMAAKRSRSLLRLRSMVTPKQADSVGKQHLLQSGKSKPLWLMEQDLMIVQSLVWDGLSYAKDGGTKPAAGRHTVPSDF